MTATERGGERRARRRLWLALAAGAAGGVLGAVLRLSRARASRRQDAGSRAFTQATTGLWPPVPRSSGAAVRIAAEHPAPARDGGDAEGEPA